MKSVGWGTEEVVEDGDVFGDLSEGSNSAAFYRLRQNAANVCCVAMRRE